MFYLHILFITLQCSSLSFSVLYADINMKLFLTQANWILLEVVDKYWIGTFMKEEGWVQAEGRDK